MSGTPRAGCFLPPRPGTGWNRWSRDCFCKATGAELWRREGYQSVPFLDGEKTVLCCARGSVDSQEAAVRIQYDLLSLEGELLLEGLDAVYDAAPEGVAVRRGDTVGIADWKGNWKYFWADKDQ